MAEIPKANEFRDLDIAPLGMAGAIQRARDEAAILAGLKIDAVSCAQRSPGGAGFWEPG